jgi:hypothetical protein
MNLATLLSATLLLFPAAPQTNMPGGQKGPLRNTFLVSAETVIDNAAAVDPTAADEQFGPQMTTLKQSQARLKSMANDDREDEIVSESNNMIFAISACHIQARADATKTGTCKGQIANSMKQMMVLLNAHKSGGTWQDGPPN